MGGGWGGGAEGGVQWEMVGCSGRWVGREGAVVDGGGGGINRIRLNRCLETTSYQGLLPLSLSFSSKVSCDLYSRQNVIFFVKSVYKMEARKKL